MEWVLVYMVVLAMLSCASANVARFAPCEDVEASACAVESVDITPCKDPKLCALKRGTNSTIVFDYTPNFSASKLLTQVYWQGKGFFTPLTGIDACPFTSCPVEAGSKQQFNYQLYLGKKLPSAPYKIQFKLWNEENADQVCCFLTDIYLKK